MKTLRHLIFLFCLLPFLPLHGLTAQGQEVPAVQGAPRKSFGDSRDKVEVTAVPGKLKVHAGDQFPIAVIFDHQAGWHIHTNHPIVPPELGEASFYIKTQIAVDPSTSPELTAHADLIQWPMVHEILVAFGKTPVKYGVFADRAIVYVPVIVPSGTASGSYTIELRATFQSCDERSCLRPVRKMKLPVQVEVVPTATSIESDQTIATKPDFKDFDPQVWSKLEPATTTVSTTTAPTTAPIVAANTPDSLPVATTAASNEPIESARAESGVAFKFFGLDFSIDPRTSGGYILLLAIATLGGFLLNLTPCVLPVIPIKIMSLSKSAGNRQRTLALGAVMAVGVVGFWIVLGLLVSTLGFFKSTNQLFQYPAFTIGIGAVIAIMAIGMCGLFTVSLPNWIYAVEFKQDSYHGSLGYGVMTAVLSTPCTAPLMGAAAAWAATQSPVITLTTFAAIGIGMASPYLVLAAFPQLVSKMPRTGPASDLIKQVMGLLMLAAASYFVGTGISGLVTRAGDPPMTAYWWVVGALIGVAGGWLAYRTVKITQSIVRRAFFVALGVGAMVGGVLMARHLTAPGPTQWVYFTPKTLEAVQHDKRIIVMEFTAEWCINCKVLEATVLNDPRVVKMLRSPGVTPMKVDLTNSEEGNQQLEKVGRLTIPLLVIFDREGHEVFKSDAYTPEQIVDAINKAKK